MERVRHRQIHPDLKDLQALKELLCKKRLDLVKHVKSKPWNLQDLDKVLQQLKKKKCRDPKRDINELFKSEAAGHDLKLSILHIMNRAKYLLEVPDMMKDVNVVMIPKAGNKNMHYIQNQRRIFLISVYRSILMKLLLKDEYKTIDSFMPDSNVGGRKGRRAQDHIFIVNGISF